MEKRAEGLAADIINGETQKAEFDLKEKATLKKLTASADGMAVGLKQISKDITALSAQNIPDPVKNIAKDILQKLPVLEAKAAADLQSDLPGMIKHLEDVQAEIREQIVKPLARSAGEAFFEADNPAALANIAKEGRKLAGLAASCNQAVAEARDFANRKSGYDRQFKRKVTEGEDMLEDLKAELSRMNQVLPEDQGQETDNKILANRLMAYGASGLRVSEREAERALKYGSDATQSDPEKVSSRAVARAAKMISSKDPAMHSAAATELAKSARRADSAGYAPLYGGTIAAETGDSPVQVPFDQVGNHLTNEGAGWAKLKRDLRDRIGGENPEIFGGEYEEAIRAYFKRLGEL
jgi:hypothetical protein